MEKAFCPMHFLHTKIKDSYKEKMNFGILEATNHNEP